MTIIKEERAGQITNHEVVIPGPMCACVVSDPQNLEALDWNQPVTVRAKINAVIAEIADRHGTTLSDVIGKSRIRNIVAARHEAMAAVVTQWPQFSFPHVGRIFGGRDHTTVMHAIAKHGVAPRSGKPAYNKFARPARQSVGVSTPT